MLRKNIEKIRPDVAPDAILVRDEDVLSEEEIIPDLTEFAREVTPDEEELERIYNDIKNGVDIDVLRILEPKLPTWLKRHTLKILGIVASFGIGLGIFHVVEQQKRLEQEGVQMREELARRNAKRAKLEATQAQERKRIMLRQKIGAGIDYLQVSNELTPYPEPIVAGFEDLRIPDKVVRSIVFDTFPKSWTYNNLEAIEFAGEALTVPPQYSLTIMEKGKKVPCPALAIALEIPETQRTHIKFGAGIVGSDFDFILNKTLVHEIAHANDPFTAGGLDIARRLYYLERLVRRVESEDRTRFADYTEKIQNPDPKVQLAARVKEYWAELFEQYLSDPETARTFLKPPDVQLVEDYLRETAPNFDPRVATTERNRLIFSIDNERKESVINSALAIILPRERFNRAKKLMRFTFQSTEHYTPEERLERVGHLRQALDKKVATFGEKWRNAHEAWLWYWMQIETLREMTHDIHDVKYLETLIEEAIPKLEEYMLEFNTALDALPKDEKRRAKRIFVEMDDAVVTYPEASSSGLFARMMTDLFSRP